MRRLFTISVMALGVTGCAAQPRLNAFHQFADLGRQQQVAIDGVIDQAIASNIDANSREILDARDLAAQSRKWGSIDPDASLDKQNQAVIQTTRQLGLIKRHAALLGAYFDAVAALADYDSASLTASAESTVGALTNLSPTLSDLKAGNVTLPKAVGAVVPIVVSGIKVRALDRELRKHADAIGRELELQERMLTFLSELIAADQDLLAQHRIVDEMAAPYANLTSPLPAGWAATRKEILLSQANAPEPAAKAAELAARMRRTFVAMCEGRASAENLASDAATLSTLLTLIQVTTSYPAGSSR